MDTEAGRILVAATASGVGKTTVVCGLLRSLQRRGLRLNAFKCGPDYLDPQFHRAVLGIPSLNLDSFLAGEDLTRQTLAHGCEHADLCIVEGAMGYYDGIAQGHDASAYDVARITRTPSVLVVDARGRALSLAAEVSGFLRFREPSFVRAVIANGASAGYFPRLKAMVERECGVPVLGYVPRLDEASLESRHLGLVSAEEVDDLRQRMDFVADAVERTVDLDALLELSREAEPIRCGPRALPAPVSGAPVVAVARDAAFSFYYEDSLELLERLGARLAYFSPLRDGSLPDGTCGLYLGGGYPELHARELSANDRLLAAVRAAIADGMPTIAECGGYLYLHQTLEDAAGQAWPMVGAVPGKAYRRDRMGRFGYVELVALRDGLLAQRGESLRAHEFHYWQSATDGDAFLARKPQSDRSWASVVGTNALYAGFPHLYLNGCPKAAKRFVDACAAYACRGEEC